IQYGVGPTSSLAVATSDEDWDGHSQVGLAVRLTVQVVSGVSTLRGSLGLVTIFGPFALDGAGDTGFVSGPAGTPVPALLGGERGRRRADILAGGRDE